MGDPAGAGSIPGWVLSGKRTSLPVPRGARVGRTRPCCRASGPSRGPFRGRAWGQPLPFLTRAATKRASMHLPFRLRERASPLPSPQDRGEEANLFSLPCSGFPPKLRERTPSAMTFRPLRRVGPEGLPVRTGSFGRRFSFPLRLRSRVGQTRRPAFSGPARRFREIPPRIRFRLCGPWLRPPPSAAFRSGRLLGGSGPGLQRRPFPSEALPGPFPAPSRPFRPQMESLMESGGGQAHSACG